jgi:hypothetical protein
VVAELKATLSGPRPFAGAGSEHAIERLVITPKERACVLLKGRFDHSLEQIADLVGSTVGGVKAALNRGCTKLAALPAASFVAPERERDPELLKLLHRYVELFNRRAVRESLRKDQRLSKASPKRAASGTGGISFALCRIAVSNCD